MAVPRPETDHQQHASSEPRLVTSYGLGMRQLQFETRVVNSSDELVQLAHLLSALATCVIHQREMMNCRFIVIHFRQTQYFSRLRDGFFDMCTKPR